MAKRTAQAHAVTGAAMALVLQAKDAAGNALDLLQRLEGFGGSKLERLLFRLHDRARVVEGRLTKALGKGKLRALLKGADDTVPVPTMPERSTTTARSSKRKGGARG